MASGLINSNKTRTTHENIIPTRAELEAVQSIVPLKVTTPRIVRQVLISPAESGLVRGCTHVLFCYNKPNSHEDHIDLGSIHAGWIKESLAGALSEHPLLAGRLVKGEAVGDPNSSSFAVVSNDSGVRLIEARVGLTLAHLFVDPNAKSELVFWKDIDEKDPQFSPLVYVQVTKFKCGGYSFGISCSILLADILLKENFLKRWVDIHNNLISKNNVLKKPLFYLPNLRKESCSRIANIFSITTSEDSGQTIVFDVTSSEESGDFSSEEFKKLSILCVEEAESKFGKKSAKEFVLLTFTTEPKYLAKIEKLSRNDVVAKESEGLEARIDRSSWEVFEGTGLQFLDGNPPVCVSHWIGSVSSELAVGISYFQGKQRMIVRFPNA